MSNGQDIIKEAYTKFKGLAENIGDPRKLLVAIRIYYEPCFDDVFATNPVRVLLFAMQAIVEKRAEHAETLIQQITKYPNTAFDVMLLNQRLQILKHDSYHKTLKDHLRFMRSEKNLKNDKSHGYLKNTTAGFQKFVNQNGFPSRDMLLKACHDLNISQEELNGILPSVKINEPTQQNGTIITSY